MSDTMALTDKSGEEEVKLNGDEASAARAEGVVEPSAEPPSQPAQDTSEEPSPQVAGAEEPAETTQERPLKRRASATFSDSGNDDFRGFEESVLDDSTAEYSKVLERMEAEVKASSESFTPVRKVIATPTATARVTKRLRQDTGTDVSRPSSALSSRSDDGAVSSTDMASSAASSPAHRGRRPTTEMSSPLLRVPLERGWKRELVYRAAPDQHGRRNADIYYYMPTGKKLRSTREIAEHLSGSGLTLDNFSFFKEPLGLDDPDKEIIRDAKMIRRVESPVTTAAPAEGKRTPKPKPAKGASPEPALKSPPASIKVKSTGSRLSGATAAKPTPPGKKQPAAAAAAGADNNNTTSWKKPRPQPPPPQAPPAPAPPPPPPQPPPPPRPPQPVLVPARRAPVLEPPQSPPRQQVQQPCSISCGGGAVPSLGCAACLCLYHPPCVGLPSGAYVVPFYCKNCKQPPPPLLSPPTPRPAPRHKPPPPQPHGKHRPVLLTMKVSGSDAGGQRVWSVSSPRAPPPLPPAPAPPRPPPPQSLARIGGRRFIVVPRSVLAHSPPYETKLRGRVSNGLAGAAPVTPTTGAKRGRGAKVVKDDTDHFTDFYRRGKANNYDVAIQIFQYLGMRDLAHSARVCKLWRDLTATPALWRHVRMKNSHVSSWGGLCAALKRHGTARLDLRKMLLPQEDAAFWDDFAEHIKLVDTLERIELCRCPARAVESVCSSLPSLLALSALCVRDSRLDPAPLAGLPRLTELRLKSLAGLSLARDLQPIAALGMLQHLSLTSIKDLGLCACEIVGELKQLVSLELGECTFRASFGKVLGGLHKLQRLRLERGTAECAAPALLRALATLPRLRQLELVNFDVKVGFDDALAVCKNIQRLLIIPTYVSQSATTNKQVLSGVLRLKDTLTHLMWGVTIELLRVTELFIDQCDGSGDSKKKDIGECIPVLKPVPGCKLPEQPHVSGPPQVEILPLPTLQRLLSAQLPSTKLKLLRIPFHATWRQSLADFQ